MTLYEKISECCADYGITITALEKELGFSRGSLGKLKTGGSTSAARLEKIASFFQTPTEWFLKNDEKEEEPGYYVNPETFRKAQELLQNPKRRLLFDASKNLSPEDIDFVLAMIERMS